MNMVLYGRLMKENIVLKEAASPGKLKNADFHDIMEDAFIVLCKDLDIPVPVWLKKNTREISRYRKTFFHREQFMEETFFDRFILEIEV